MSSQCVVNTAVKSGHLGGEAHACLMGGRVGSVPHQIAQQAHTGQMESACDTKHA
jgi:hypothetical protein